MSLENVLLVVAFIAFVLAALGWGFKKIDLIAIGLAAWVLSLFVGELRHIHLTLSLVLLVLAFIAFVLAAIGWKYKKVGLVGVGLALWVGSSLIGLVS